MTHRILLFLYLPLLIITLSSTGCESVFYADNQDLETDWLYRKPVTFDFIVDDSSAQYDIYINVRHENAFEYQNLWLFVTIDGPDELSSTDTINCPLAMDDGRWFGSGTGAVIDLPVLIYKGHRFSRNGKHKLKIKHGMRNDSLKHIRRIGVLIKKTQPNEK
ncbi:MAG TPA: hypothetical protein DDX92_11595 [Flavobacteriales bacterium]|jgi:gliding motility-associated lipoprotein GldH|nr:hypothetical protein [Flavobacteriales bacterium]